MCPSGSAADRIYVYYELENQEEDVGQIASVTQARSQAVLSLKVPLNALAMVVLVRMPAW